MTQSNEKMQAGKEKWEGRTDKKLFDYLDSELGSSYKDLQNLLFTILKVGLSLYLVSNIYILLSMSLP